MTPDDQLHLLLQQALDIITIECNAAEHRPDANMAPDSSAACIRFCENQPLIDVLRSVKQGGPEWAYRYVTLCFAGTANGWVSLYPFQDSQAPYFDFMYAANEHPQQVLAALLKTNPQCSVIDWSRGRLACLEVRGVDVESLAEIIQAVASLVWNEGSQLVDGWDEEMGKGC